MKTNLTLLSLGLLCQVSLTTAQEKQEPLSNDSLTKEVRAIKQDVSALKNLKITGWIQAQFQYAETRGVANFDGGNFSPNSDKRFMIRRGRIKFTYNGKNSQYVMQINGTERGLNLTEIFAVATDPWTKSFSLVAGVMNRPFGFEIDQSSVNRESPERSRYTQILMPNERDLGAKIVFAPQKTSKLFGLRLDAGLYNGQGAYVPGTTTPAGYPSGTTPVLGVNEFDFMKDFIGRLSFYKDLNTKIRVGLGASHYNGGIMYSNSQAYKEITTDTLGIKNWAAEDTSSKKLTNRSAPRVYYGVEAFFSINTVLGTTTIRGEYITGTQPGSSGSTASPFFFPSPQATYIRSFDGMYVYFIHRIAKTKHEVLVKYEWYDPNTKVSGTDMLGSTKNKFTSADIKYTQLGLGYNYYMYENVKFMLYYNMITNETTGNGTLGITGFTQDIKDNIFTVRMTYRF